MAVRKSAWRCLLVQDCLRPRLLGKIGLFRSDPDEPLSTDGIITVSCSDVTSCSYIIGTGESVVDLHYSLTKLARLLDSDIREVSSGLRERHHGILEIGPLNRLLNEAFVFILVSGLGRRCEAWRKSGRLRSFNNWIYPLFSIKREISARNSRRLKGFI